MWRIFFTGGGGDRIERPCAIGGTPSIATLRRPPALLAPVKAVARSICSTLAVDTWISALPMRAPGAGAPPVSYFTAQMKLLPPRLHICQVLPTGTMEPASL